MATLLNNEVQELFIQLTGSEQEAVLNMMKTFLESRYERETPTLKIYNREINESARQMKGGEVCSHEDVMQLAKDWS